MKARSVVSETVTHSWWRSLSFHLALAINLTAVIVLIAFWVLDYRREHLLHLQDQVQQLRQEAKVLGVAQRVLDSTDAFQQYIDKYCHQMERHISPGHHIIVTDSSGEVVARAHERDDPNLESKMAIIRGDGSRTFKHGNEEYVVAGLGDENGTTILVTQSLAPVRRIIRRQAISRAVSMTVLVAMIVTVTHIILFRWVRRPIRALIQGVKAIAGQHFDHRIDQQSTSEFQFLADGFNQMGESLEQHELRRQYEMDKAHRIQLRLLPPDLIEVPGCTVKAKYIPTDSVGGDYYDVIRHADGRWLFVIADVSGHGVSAALVTAMLKALIRQSIGRGCGLDETVQILNTEIHSLVESEHFVTCLMMLCNTESGELEYINCGHEPGLILNGSGEVQKTLDCTGLPLGAAGNGLWEIHQARMQRGDRLCLATDGLAEVFDDEGQIFGRVRLENLICSTACESPALQMDHLLREITQFQGHAGFPDDVTIVIIQRDANSQLT